MKKICKRIIVPILALLLAFTAIPAQTAEAASIGKPTGVKLYGYNTAKQTSCYVTYNTVSGADGYQYKCTYGSKTICSGTTASTYAYLTKLSRKKIYRFKVRAFYYNDYGTKVYGSYSKTIPIVPDAVINAGKCKAGGSSSSPYEIVGWDKIAGAKSYTVYVSTSSSSGYEKVKTVSGSKNSVKISSYKGKKLKTGTTYYVKICTKTRYNGKTYSSKKNIYRSFYLYTIYK